MSKYNRLAHISAIKPRQKETEMKYLLKITIVLIILAAIPFIMIPVNADAFEAKDMRGLWVATVVNTDYPSKPTTDIEALKNEAVKILDTAKNTGLNAVFLQVRPTADAFYRSDYFPWSKYLTGTLGKAPAGGFDPLQFWIDEAHNRGLELHAWINPYRITKKSGSEAKHPFPTCRKIIPRGSTPTG
jgi:uncharacterized lipoprotein YddW (UPF0748 family)